MEEQNQHGSYQQGIHCLPVGFLLAVSACQVQRCVPLPVLCRGTFRIRLQQQSQILMLPSLSCLVQGCLPIQRVHCSDDGCGGEYRVPPRDSVYLRLTDSLQQMPLLGGTGGSILPGGLCCAPSSSELVAALLPPLAPEDRGPGLRGRSDPRRSGGFCFSGRRDRPRPFWNLRVVMTGAHQQVPSPNPTHTIAGEGPGRG